MPGNDISLQDALAGFHQGVQNLAINSAINSAQQQMNDLNNQQLDEMERRQQMMSISKNLELNMTKAQANPAQLQAALGAFQMPQINNANDMMLQGLMHNDQSMQDTAKKQQAFEEDPKQKIANIMANSRIAAANAKNSANANQDKALGQVSQFLESARGQPAVQQAEKDLYASNKLKTLMGDDPNSLNPEMVKLAVLEAGKIGAGGVASEGEINSLNPKSFRGDLAKLWEQFSNSPTPANQGAFLKVYKDYADKVTNDAQGLITNRYGRIIDTNSDRLGDKYTSTLKDVYMNRFKNEAAKSGEGSASAASSQPPQAPLKTVRLKNGQTVKGRYLPDGRFQVED